MSFIDTGFLKDCILTLEKAVSALNQVEENSADYKLYRSACIKEFEIILEQSGKLLRKALKRYFATPKSVDKLVFKDVFRHAAKCDLLRKDEIVRWMHYRDNRNNTAHDYGVQFAQKTLKLLPDFISDSKILEKTLREIEDD